MAVAPSWENCNNRFFTGSKEKTQNHPARLLSQAEYRKWGKPSGKEVHTLNTRYNQRNWNSLALRVTRAQKISNSAKVVTALTQPSMLKERHAHVHCKKNYFHTHHPHKMFNFQQRYNNKNRRHVKHKKNSQLSPGDKEGILTRIWHGTKVGTVRQEMGNDCDQYLRGSHVKGSTCRSRWVISEERQKSYNQIETEKTKNTAT